MEPDTAGGVCNVQVGSDAPRAELMRIGKTAQEGAGRDDFNAERSTKGQQVRIARDDEAGSRRQRGGEVWIVFGIPAALLAQRRRRHQACHANEPIQGRPRIAPEPGAFPCRVSERCAPLVDDQGTRRGSKPTLGRIDQAQVRFRSPTARANHNAGVKNGNRLQRLASLATSARSWVLAVPD